MPDEPRNMILTGASRGIGHATVKRFSAEGWRIITCSRDEIPEACKRDPNWSHHLPTDLSRPESVSEFVDAAVSILGDAPLHALINRIPLHRMGTPDEVASCVYQLCNSDFGYVTGTEIFVTGGQHL
jgi:NAD(P)-dependent dehydrogenase (short-subunit alcohol dehydrogenase family)